MSRRALGLALAAVAAASLMGAGARRQHRPPAPPTPSRYASAPPPAEIAPGLAPPLPAALARAAAGAEFDSVATLGIFEGIPYRRDGVIIDSGDFAEWEHPDRIHFSPGLNCSGHLVAAARILSGIPLQLDAVRWDRNGDSGPGAPQGRDWDFGWDVVMGVAMAATGDDLRQILYLSGDAPARTLADAPSPLDAQHLRGFSVWDRAAWARVLGEMTPDRFYVGSFSRVGRNGRMLHHHTVLFAVDGPAVWVQGASPNNPHGPQVESMEVTDPDELERLLTQFRHYKSEHLLIIGVPLALDRMDLVPGRGLPPLSAPR